MERLIELLSMQDARGVDTAPQIYCAVLAESLAATVLPLAERLRDAGLRVEMHCGGGSLKSQLKRADRVGAGFALIVGPEEAAQGLAVVKDLRGASGQQSIPSASVVDWFVDRLATRPGGRSG